jgi:excisionase family DNA binding protein
MVHRLLAKSEQNIVEGGLTCLRTCRTFQRSGQGGLLKETRNGHCGGRGASVVEKLYTADEIGERLGFTAETILEWARRGDLESVRIGRHRRFRESVVLRFIERHRDHNVVPLDERREPAGGSSTFEYRRQSSVDS